MSSSNLMASTSENVTIDLLQYHSFSFIGEGKSNFVIGAVRQVTGERIAWRFAKVPGTRLMSTTLGSDVINDYVNKLIFPFFSEEYLINMKTVMFQLKNAHQLGKIPKLPENGKIESFEELLLIPQELSVLPQGQTNEKRQTTELVTALEMVDATYLTKSTLEEQPGKTITFEIKPKQAENESHNRFDVPYCQNCINAVDAVFVQKKFEKMTEFCPLDLYSGDFERMFRAIHSLFVVPHLNLRVFVDGILTYPNNEEFDEKKLEEFFFPQSKATCEDLITAICLALSGNNMRQNFKLQESSVLKQIWEGQQIDTIGIMTAHQIFKNLSLEVKEEMSKREFLTEIGLDEILKPKDGESEEHMVQMRRYMLAATMKDCSIMVSLRLIHTPPTQVSTRHIQLPNGKIFEYGIKVVDLDPKTSSSLVAGHKRIMGGLKYIQALEQPEQEIHSKYCF